MATIMSTDPLLLYSYLEDEIQQTADAETARWTLHSLISEENTRLTLTREEIARRVQRDGESIRRVIEQMIDFKLICEIEEEEPPRYELMHEYLISPINQLMGGRIDATKRANRMLGQHLTNYDLNSRHRIPIKEWLFIRRHADMEKGERGRELLGKSLRGSLLKLSALAVSLMIVAALSAAWFSLSEEWESVRLSDGHRATARRAVFSPDGRLLVSASEDSTVIVWDYKRRERLATLTDHRGEITSLDFSPDGRWFATGSKDQTVIVWDAERLEKKVQLLGHSATVRPVVFSRDGKLLASASNETPTPETIIWQTGTWEKIREIPATVGSDNFLFSPDGRHLIGSEGRLLDLATGKETDILRAGIDCAFVQSPAFRLLHAKA